MFSLFQDQLQKDQLTNGLKNTLENSNFTYGGRSKMTQSIDFKAGSAKKLASKGTFERHGLPSLHQSGKMQRSGTLSTNAFDRSVKFNPS